MTPSGDAVVVVGTATRIMRRKTWAGSASGIGTTIGAGAIIAGTTTRMSMTAVARGTRSIITTITGPIEAVTGCRLRPAEA